MNISTKQVKISQLYLDPNNYRFIDDGTYVSVADDKVMDPNIQQRTMRLLIGRNQENIQDLIISFKTNGYLELEPIQVRQLSEKSYMVLEGNRRVATLKYLWGKFNDHDDIGVLSESSFSSISICIVSANETREQLVTMGLHHISGKKRWNPLNQCQMVHDLKDKYQMTVDEICKSLGSTKQFVNKCLRIHALIESYKRSDYGDQFQTNMFSFFEEILKSPNIRTWLSWSNDLLTCLNKDNEERLFSWISHVEQYDNSDEEETTIVLEPIITKSVEIRDLSGFINDEKAINRMERTRNFQEAYVLSESIGRTKMENSLDSMAQDISSLFSFSEYLLDADYHRIHELIQKLSKLDIKDPNSNLTSISQIYFASITSHFSNIVIEEYRGLRNLHIENLQRFNLFVGGNNSGKTMLLEAVYTLALMNDMQKLLNLERFRSRSVDVSINWLMDNLHERYNIEGTFNNVKCTTNTRKYLDDSINMDKNGYMCSLSNKSTIGYGKNYQMKLDMYDNKEPIQRYDQIVNICPIAFTSPYRANRNMLVEAHRRVAERGEMETLVNFIRDSFDTSITGIRMVDTEMGGRFIVTSSNTPEGLDLTKYGEGLIRVFEISLYIIASANGCVFIDEIDSGLHTSILNKFVNFITMLSDRFNVQLFVTTHSRELVDAFADIELKKDLMAYRLDKNVDNHKLYSVSGIKLKKLIDNFNVDIRQ